MSLDPLSPSFSGRPTAPFSQGHNDSRPSRRPAVCAVEGLESRQLLSAAPGTIVPAEATTLQVLVGAGANQFNYVTFTDASGVVRRFDLKGAGAATVNFTGTNLQSAPAKLRGENITGTGIGIDTIAISGTNSRSTVSFTSGTRRAPGAPLTLNGLSDNAPVGTLTGNVDLVGNVSVNGAINKIDVSALTGGTITTAVTDPVTGQPVTDPVTGLPVTTSTPATFTSGAIGSITVTGNLGLNITSSGTIGNVKVGGNLTGSITADQIKGLTVNGNVDGSKITLNQSLVRNRTDLGRLTVRGTVSNTTVNSAGSIGPVSAGALSNDNLYAGVIFATGNTTGLPATLSELPSQASIKSVTARSTAVTNIAAFTVGRLSLGSLNTANTTTAGTRFGVAGASVAGVTGTASVNGKRFRIGKLNNQASAQTALSKAGLSSTDFVIVIV